MICTKGPDGIEVIQCAELVTAKLVETAVAAEHANRILDYLMKSKKQVGIHDPVFEAKTVTKAVEEPKPQPKTQGETIDAMIKAYETPTAPDNLPLHEYVAKIQKEMEKP